MSRAHAERWSERPWDSDAGRCAWYLHRAGQSLAFRKAAQSFYSQFVADVGPDRAHAQLRACGIDHLPAWLAGGDNGT